MSQTTRVLKKQLTLKSCQDQNYLLIIGHASTLQDCVPVSVLVSLQLLPPYCGSGLEQFLVLV